MVDESDASRTLAASPRLACPSDPGAGREDGWRVPGGAGSSEPENWVRRPTAGVTVIIAVRNGLPFVRETVLSALSQEASAGSGERGDIKRGSAGDRRQGRWDDHPDHSVDANGEAVYEVVVVDDHSTDGTLEALATIDDPRLRLLRNPGRGVSSARNLGIDVSRTRWLMFLDADDCLRPGAAAALLAAVRPGMCGAYGDYERIDETGRVIGRRGLVRQGRRKPSGDVLRAMLAGNFLINGGVLICDREACRHVGGFDPDLSLCEDWHLWCRLAALAPFAYVPARVMDYRVHRSSVMMHKRRTFEDFRPALDRIFSDPGIAARLPAAELCALRHQGAGSLMTYCAQQAARSGAFRDAWSLTLVAVRHQPRRVSRVLARVAGAVVGL